MFKNFNKNHIDKHPYYRWTPLHIYHKKWFPMERRFGEKLRFNVERSKFSCWTVEIFMMNGPDFHNNRWWQVEIFIMTGPKLLYCFGLNPGARGKHLVIQL